MPSSAKRSRKKTSGTAASPSLTPMLRHYLEVKADHSDAVLLYRMGDFYEIFFDDAVRVAPLLEVTLTARHKGTPNEVPMCGVPHHAIDGYIGKLLRAGFKVAMCDQVEDPKQAKGLVKREVTRVITPGTVSEPTLLDAKEANLLAALVWRPEAEQGAAAYLDVSTGDFLVHRWNDREQALDDLSITRPREAVFALGSLPETLTTWIEREVACTTDVAGDRLLDRARAADLLMTQLATSTLRGYGLAEDEAAVEAAALALAYARETQLTALDHIHSLKVRRAADSAVLDATTLANLEVFRPLRDGGKGSATLIGVLDRTVTAGGGRLLREWLRRPLKEPSAIEARHDAVEELLTEDGMRESVRSRLAQVADIERLVARAVLGSLGPREAAALRDALAQAPPILSALATVSASLLIEVAAADACAPLAAALEATLVPAPPATLKDGGVIAEGIDAELDRCRSLAKDSKRHILELEARERQATGITSLKVRFNKVFGYYLEVTKANQHLVPEHYIRKQTLVNAERYVTPEIKELEEQILGAEERQVRLEEEHFDRLRRAVAEAAEPLRALARALASLDLLGCFAEVAARRGYRRPSMAPLGTPIEVREGRHPVVEVTHREPFVPNDVLLDGESSQIVVLTGPNMGGKSTYLRQVALLVLMAQVGSFVPADEARIGVVDRIFTRVGASDDLARGESTFMVEMIETANILHHATEHSLVILDEVGRGTATFDGLSLAWSIVEYLHEDPQHRPKTLFATHYHELTELAELLQRVVNRTLAVREWQDRILFLRRVKPGAADKSYGLHVARLAGLPEDVVRRAGEVLANLEDVAHDASGLSRRAEGASSPTAGGAQLALFGAGAQASSEAERLVSALRTLDVDGLSPRQALDELYRLRQLIEDS